MNKRKLLNVAKALRESPNPDQFTMQRFGYDCGTPACALGHYAVRHDLQKVFGLRADGYLKKRRARTNGLGGGCTAPLVREHFGITESQAYRLFAGNTGCGGATTAIAAAVFIEKFVETAS